jgi:teichuronic acid biosynthesis glycosyltransferase TuaH
MYRNVTWVGTVPKHEIPKILRGMDACMIPYRTDLAFNTYSFPMKTLEYFASGKPVIATDIQELRQYARAGLLTIIEDASDFVEAIRRFQKHGWSKKKQDFQRAEVLHHTWEKKIRTIMSTLKDSFVRRNAR